MKRTLVIGIIGLAAVIGVVFSAPDAHEFGKISLPLGKVQVKTESGTEWERAMPNRKVYEGDVIRTLEKSRCEITLSTGGKVRIGADSELELNSADVKPMEKNYQAKLTKGNAWVSAKAAFGEKKNVSIRTPTAVAAIRGTVYRTKADEDESSVMVYDGKVAVNQSTNVDEKTGEAKSDKPGEGGKPKFKLGPVQEVQAPTEVAGPYEVSLEDWITLVKGMQINVRKDGKYSMFQFDQAADSSLDFVKWNQELDAETK